MAKSSLKKYFSILKYILKGIRIKDPSRSDVLVFDYEGSKVLKETILGGIPHSILYTRYEIFYFGPQIILKIIKNFFVTELHVKFSISIVGRLYLLYLFSCVEHISPKVVITWVDDSRSFHYVSRHYKRAAFYAVSNGFRYEYPVVIPKNGYKISMPHFICYGDFEVDLYKKYGHKIDRYHTVGPVIGSYFMTEKAKDINSNKYDLCLVSQCEPTIIKGIVYPEIRNAIVKLDEFLSRYIEEFDLTLCIALRSTDPVELDYFRKAYGTRALFSEKANDWLATYRAMAESDTIVVFDSTAAVEAYGWGKKVLFTNFSGTDRYSIPVSNFCFIKGDDYKTFSEKLTEIRNMSSLEYHQNTKENRDYLVRFDPEKPAHKYVRNLIKMAIEC